MTAFEKPRAETLDALLPLAARLKARKAESAAGSPVFAVPGGWAAETLRAEPGVATVQTLSELETAVQDENIGAIFVPCGTFGRTALELILGRNGLSKTIFWEE
jgi:hypothetical protein